MLLIADGGSTKTDWAIIDTKQHKLVDRFTTPGLNPMVMQPEVLTGVLNDHIRPQIADLIPNLTRVEYYGAGCLGKGRERMEKALKEATGCSKVIVDSDLEGAALGLCGNRRGIVVILGTGSNSALWDGRKVIEHTPSLGYILGDEGSGASLGKALINAVYKHRFNDDLCRQYTKWSGLSEAEIITNVYRQPQANKFLAQQVPFLKENLHQHQVHTLVLDEFTSFISRNIASYTGFPHCPVMATGGIAKNFENVWFDALDNFGVSNHEVLDTPIEGLIAYALK